MVPLIGKKIERAIRRLPGVEGAVVVMDSKRQIHEIHVLARTEASPKELVRRVELTAQQILDRPVDYRTISVVQLRSKSILQSGPRPRLVEVLREGGRLSVILESGQSRWVGEVEVSDAQGPQDGAAAAAEAVRQILGRQYEPRVGGVKEVQAAGQHLNLVLVNLHHSGGEEALLGTAFVRGDPLTSAVRAVLDATNPRLEQAL